ncbi:MAG: hypothetical protein LC685_04875 [Actinobacteria bacterium]|nr:hypothetical protein [Actinomycetota bacterium]
MVGTDIRAVPDPSLEPPDLPTDDFEWHRALAPDELPEGRFNDELTEALAAAHAYPGPALVEVVADPLLV